MPVPAALVADPVRLRTRLSQHLRRTAAAVAGRIGRPRGAALSPSAASLTPPRGRAHGPGAACCSPCSVELPGEAM
jgi:hypothetical protein